MDSEQNQQLLNLLDPLSIRIKIVLAILRAGHNAPDRTMKDEARYVADAIEALMPWWHRLWSNESERTLGGFMVTLLDRLGSVTEVLIKGHRVSKSIMREEAMDVNELKRRLDEVTVELRLGLCRTMTV